MSSPPSVSDNSSSTGALSLAALGVVYGDIGTSPLYAFKQAFNGTQSIAATHANVLGVLSLIVWSLILVVSLKYLMFVMKADNNGEGGIIALVALLNPWHAAPGTRRNVLMIMGLFGAALLFGDGTITPAISVLSAVEGLTVESKSFNHLVIPITVGILFALFALQRMGTGKIGAVFGPVMLIWFATLGFLGIGAILHYPGVLAALNPVHGIYLLSSNGMLGFAVLGTVFLAVTGAEALFADMGHFGRSPIRMAWFFVALPCLLLNYFGQGAVVLEDPASVAHPFYGLSANWAHYPLVLLATVATIIASQAVISGVFSLTRQAIQLGQLPSVHIRHTDRDQIGQVYIPFVNWSLMVATIGLVLAFRTSDNLAAAYGLAVAADMVITTCLAFFVAKRFGWHPLLAGLISLFFIVIDLAFFGANLLKFFQGGWYPVLVACALFVVMSVWRYGLKRVNETDDSMHVPIASFPDRTEVYPGDPLAGTAVYLTPPGDDLPTILARDQQHGTTMYRQTVFVTVLVEDVPRVGSAERAEIVGFGPGIYRVTLRFGFMQSLNVPVALRFCETLGLEIDLDQTVFYVERDAVVPDDDGSVVQRLKSGFFAVLWRNSAHEADRYQLPSDKIKFVGRQLRI